MSSHEDEIEVIANKVAERYFGITKEYVQTVVRLHKAECTVGKATKLLSFISGVIGGACVAFIGWFLRK